MKTTYNIAVIGLGYVGLPLAIELAKKFSVIGFDNNTDKIHLYKNFIDDTHEVGETALRETSVIFTSDEHKLSESNFYIIAVPTPINNDKTPNLNPIISACEIIGKYLKKDSTVVFESTVYPGTTEEICITILENLSGLKINEDFYVGYSPERINPGDTTHTLTNITKIISGSNEIALNKLNAVYSSIITAGLYKAPSIKVAEAAKVIENAQRDINIAFMNELSIIFQKMNIDTYEVLKAASTKWNFLNFTPGLVGGHCIGVDPYYFIYKAELLGYKSQIIAAGRQINNSMGSHIASNVVKEIFKSQPISNNIKIGILGFTFKENCADYRNTKVVDIIEELKEYNFTLYIHDPLVKPIDVLQDYNIQLVSKECLYDLDTVIIAVPHEIFRQHYNIDVIKSMLKKDSKIIFDLKSLYSKEDIVKNNLQVWTL